MKKFPLLMSFSIYLFSNLAMAVGPSTNIIVSHCEAVECVPSYRPLISSDCDEIWTNLMPHGQDYINAETCYAEALSFARDIQSNGWATYVQWRSGRAGISFGFPSGYLSETSSDSYGTGNRIGNTIILRMKVK